MKNSIDAMFNQISSEISVLDITKVKEINKKVGITYSKSDNSLNKVRFNMVTHDVKGDIY